jgi:hypothetical protein
MADEIRLTYDEQVEQEKREQRELTRAFKRVFCTPDGELVLMHLLNRLGYFAKDPSVIDPKLTAVANWILMQMGVYAPNERLMQYVEAMTRCAKGDE